MPKTIPIELIKFHSMLVVLREENLKMVRRCSVERLKLCLICHVQKLSLPIWNPCKELKQIILLCIDCNGNWIWLSNDWEGLIRDLPIFPEYLNIPAWSFVFGIKVLQGALVHINWLELPYVILHILFFNFLQYLVDGVDSSYVPSAFLALKQMIRSSWLIEHSMSSNASTIWSPMQVPSSSGAERQVLPMMSFGSITVIRWLWDCRIGVVEGTSSPGSKVSEVLLSNEGLLEFIWAAASAQGLVHLEANQMWEW